MSRQQEPYDNRWAAVQRMGWRGAPWESVRLVDGRGANVEIRVRRSGRRRLWTWWWSEGYLGHTTIARSAIGYRVRPDCIGNLTHMLTVMGWEEMAEAVLRWEMEDAG